MLGTINPQIVAIDQQVVAYPGRDHVCILTVKRFDGRSYKPVDMTDVTRVILSFPEADPVIVYDSSVQAVFTHVGATLTVDLSDYAMQASVLGCQIILYDAEHPAGQVLVDDIDAVVQFDFRNVSPVGGIPAPAVDYLTDAPIDGVTYARKDGMWVPVDAMVSGVSSVNGQTGVVVLDTDDIAEGVSNLYFTNGRAAAAAPVQTVDGQTGAVSLSSSYAPLSHVGDGGAAHSNAVAAGAAGFMSGADKTKLDGIASAATVNSTDAQLRDRATHTGTQLSTTISDFIEASQDVIGAAITAGANVTVSYNDTTGLTTINATGGGASLPAVQTFTGAKTLGLSDINTYNVSQDATAQAVTLPAQATVSWTADAEIHIERGAAGAVTVVGAGGVQINGSVAGTFTLGAQYSVVTLKRKAANLWTLFGNAS